MLKSQEYKRWNRSISFGGHVEYSRGIQTVSSFVTSSIKNYPDSPSARYRIRCGFIFFHSGERIKKYPHSLANLPDACAGKPYPERKSCGFKK